jgi:hypothetical protein
MLEAEIARPPGYADSMRFAQQFDPNTRTIEVTLEGAPDDLPITWPLMAADYLQNLRCALNYLVWELARLNLARTNQARDPINDTQFPIFTKARAWNPRRVIDLDPSHAARIRALQPNEAAHLSQMTEEELIYLDVPTLAKRHVLGPLVELTNEDKHRVLPAVLGSWSKITINDATAVDCEIVATNVFLVYGLQNGAKWAEFTVRPIGPEPKVHVNDNITPEVVIGGHGMRVLKQIGPGVERMVQEFAPIF